MTILNTVSMRGAYTVRTGLSNYFQANLNPLLAKLRDEWHLEFDELPDVLMKDIDPYKQLALDHGIKSMIEIDVQRSRDFNQVDIDAAGAEQYQIVYVVRIYTWCRAQGRENALRMRDDMAAAVRVCLLLSPSLNNNNTFRLNARTLSEDYSDSAAIGQKGDRWLAGVYHTLELTVDEGLVRAALGDVEVVTVNEELLGRASNLHPALR